jgi:hypothetical protein
VIGGVEQRALELVAGVEQQPVAAGRRHLLLDLAHARHQPRRAAGALALRDLGRAADHVEAVDRLQSRVDVVGVQDRDREVLGRGRQAEAQRGGDKGRGSDPGSRGEAAQHGNPPRKRGVHGMMTCSHGEFESPRAPWPRPAWPPCE